MKMSRVFLLSLLGCSLWCGVQCTCGDNPPGPNDCIATLNITSVLRILLAPPGTVCIQCTFNGVPATDATFQLDSGDVDPEDGVTVNGVLVVCDSEQLFSTASITDLSCTSAMNGGQAQRQQSLLFLEIFRAPMITGVTTLNESDTLALDCDASNSRPSPSVAWFDPEGEMVSGSRTLMIENIPRAATGTYSCVASESGTTMTSAVTVTVQSAPDVTADRQDLVDVPLGSTLQLSCSLLGVPPPDSVIWTHNSTTLNDADSDITISSDATSTSLSRTNVADTGGGQYECSASNVVGSNSDSTEVRVQLPPGPPTNQMVTGRTTTTLTISWSNPDFDGFSPIASFRVEVMWEGDDFDRTFVGDAGTTQFTVGDLRPFTEHALRLFVSNAVMLEGESAEVVGTTVSLKLPVVQNAVASPINSTAITVQWEEPSFEADTTAPVEGYTLLYMPASGGSTTTVSIAAFGTDAITATVKELEKGTEYIFSIIARNSAGDGATLTLVLVQTDIDPPSAPLSFTAQTPDPFTIILSWVEPDDNGGRPVTGYELFISDVTPAMVELTSNDLSHRFDNLNENTSYMLAILAVNSADLRSPNATLTVTTPPVGPPQVPPNLTVDTITNVSAIARWDEAGGFPNFYIFQMKRGLEEWSDGKSVNLTSDMSQYDLTELDPLATYDTRVQSQNLNGLSEFSAEVEFITFGDIEIDGPAQNETVVSGLPVTLNCQLQTEGSDNDPIVYTWTKEDGSLPEGSTQEANGILLIPSAQEEDSGVYFCSANGVTGRFVINIEDPPEDPTSPPNDPGLSVGTGLAVGLSAISIVLLVVVVLIITVMLCLRKSKQGSKPPDDTYETIPMQYTPSRNQEQVSATEPMIQENPAYQKHTTNRSDGGRLEMTPNAAYDTHILTQRMSGHGLLPDVPASDRGGNHQDTNSRYENIN